MNKHKKEEPIVFYVHPLIKYLFGVPMIVVGLCCSLLFIHLIIQTPPSFDIFSWTSSDLILALLTTFIVFIVTIVPLSGGLYYFLKPVPQVKIEGNMIYYSSMCEYQAGRNISPFLPYMCSVEDNQFSLDSVDSFNSTSLIFSFKGIANQQYHIPQVQIRPLVKKKDHIRIREIISERIKQN